MEAYRMNADHVSTECLFEASKGGELATAEVSHVRDCSECLEVLVLLTRHSRLRIQKLASGSISHHVPLADLWLHGRGSEMDGTYRTHLIGCAVCSGKL